MSDLEEGYPMTFDLDEDEVPNHEHASDQEEEESIDDTDIPQTEARPTRTTGSCAMLTFDFNYQDRQWTGFHEAYKAKVSTPLKEEPNPQDGNNPIMYPPLKKCNRNYVHKRAKDKKNMVQSPQEGAQEHRGQCHPRKHCQTRSK
jgi:hypothetical protein